jgi:hypothetical protein
MPLPEPITRHRRLAVILLVALGLATTAAPSASARPPDAVVSTDVSFVGDGGVVLHGTVSAPAGPPARHPAMVMLTGAGSGGRQTRLPEAEAFARHGIVTLVYDKRTEGYSLLHRDYSVLAGDALAAVRLLRTRADVDPAKLGLWALSEGAFVAPLAANRSTDVRFVITVGAVGVTPAAQTAWAYGQFLHHDGVSGSLPHTMQVTATRVTVGAGLFPEADFDPVPAWRDVRQPVLAQWGRFDRMAVPAQSSRAIAEALHQGGNTDYTIRFVPGVRHDLNLTSDGGFDRSSRLPADYGAFEASWIGGHEPTVGVQTYQDRSSVAPTPLAWYESPPVQLAAVLLFLVAFAGYPLTALVRRIRGRRRASNPAATVLAATGLVTTVGFLLYMVFMLATAANVVGPVVFGRPVPWLVLQLLAGSTVVAAVATALSRRRHRPDARLGLLVSAGVVFVPWAVYWGLLVPW